MRGLSAPASPVPAYDQLSTRYDLWRSHPAYADWILAVFDRRSSHRQVRTALDVGCGTGQSFAPLSSRGVTVTGVDPSAGMLAVAKRKYPDVRLVQAALPALPVLGRFDYVSCLNDVVNHLDSEDDLVDAFTSLAGNMAEDATAAFDTSTSLLYETFFARTERTRHGRWTFDWNGTSETPFRPGAQATGVLEIRSAAQQLLRQVFTQRHHPEDRVRTSLRAAGLDVVGRYGVSSDGVLEEHLDATRHIKAVWVVRHTCRLDPKGGEHAQEDPQGPEADRPGAVVRQERLTRPRGGVGRTPAPRAAAS